MDLHILHLQLSPILHRLKNGIWKCLFYCPSVITVAFILVLNTMLKYFMMTTSLTTSLNRIFCTWETLAHSRPIYNMVSLVNTCQARLWFLGEVRIMINSWFSEALCFVHQYFLGTEVKGFFGVRNHYWIVPCSISANHHYLHERQQRLGCHLIFSLEYKHALLLANISKQLLWLSWRYWTSKLLLLTFITCTDDISSSQRNP